MKYVLPALVAVVCTLTACNTTADRRDLFAPNKPQGPYTERLRGMTLAGRFNHRSTTYTYPVTASATQETGPIAPPPPPPPPPSTTPDTDVGAPAATPMPEVAPQLPAAAPTTPAPSAAAPAPAPALTAPSAAPTPAAAGTPAPNIPGLSQ